MKILFICKRRLDVDNQKTYGLETSASLIVGFLAKSGIEVEMGRAFDANDIDRIVTKSNPTHVILEALWVTPDKLKEITSIKRHRSRQWIIRIHSRIAFLANEGIAFSWFMGYRDKVYPVTDNLWIAPNSNEAVCDIEQTLDMKAVYLPNIYCPPAYELPPKLPSDPGVINVGVFGAIRPMKNHLLQVVSAIRYANRYNLKARIHMNVSRMEQRGENCFKNIEALLQAQNGKHELVKYDWLPHEEFVALCVQMDIALQVSFSETFNIIAADSVYHGTPCIGSLSIEWLPSWWKVTDPNNSEEIVAGIEQAKGMLGQVTLWYAQRSLEKWNRAAEDHWLRFLAD